MECSFFAVQATETHVIPNPFIPVVESTLPLKIAVPDRRFWGGASDFLNEYWKLVQGV